MRIATAAALALVAASASAQIPQPLQGNGGFLFSAWDDMESYTVYLGINFLDFDPNADGQTFDLGADFASTFADINNISWSVISADGDGDVLFGGAAFYATGSITNLTSGAGVLAFTGAADNYITSTNAACGADPICTATNADTHYAGRDSYGADLGFSGGVDVGASFGDSIGGVFVEQVAFNPDGQAIVTALPFTWDLSADGTLTYGAPQVVPVPAAFWLMLTGVAGLLGTRRRA